MTDGGGIASQQSLKQLIKSLLKELSSVGETDNDKIGMINDDRDWNNQCTRTPETNCVTLIQAIVSSPPTQSPAMDKVLAFAKRKVSSFRRRATAREFRVGIAAVEKQLLDRAPDVDVFPAARKPRSKDASKTKKMAKPKVENRATASSSGASLLLPSTVADYLDRLKRQSKELYKNPPSMPPPPAYVDEYITTDPQRDETSGRFRFTAAASAAATPHRQRNDDGSATASVTILGRFRPNRSPEEILRGGAFGGTYFRTITSAVTDQQYIGSHVVRETLPESWRTGLDEAMCLTSSTYRPERNKFGAKCGGSLGMWESSGWIADIDPYGWFQWYCRFYQGRRSSDDIRQIQRWLGVAGPKGRFKSQLCNKIIAARTHVHDTSISPVIRQTLWHWGLEITDEVLKEHQASRR